MTALRRLNHAVLYVRDASRSARFYQDVFDFDVVSEDPGRAVFLRARGSDNHHDLGLFSLGSQAPGPQRGRVGLYHLAWEVPTIEDLASVRTTLQANGGYTGASDHGATKSIYGRDLDGNEFEVMWLLPRDEWSRYEREAITAPLDLDAEIARHQSRA